MKNDCKIKRKWPKKLPKLRSMKIHNHKTLRVLCRDYYISKVFLEKSKVSHMASPLGIFIETQMMSVVSTFIWTVPDIDYILRFLMLDASIHRVLWLIAIVRLIKKFILNIGIFFFFSFWPHTYEPCVTNQNNSQ